MAQDGKLMLEIADVCIALGLSRPTVMTFINRDHHPIPCLTTGRHYKVPKALLESWVMEEAMRQTEERVRKANQKGE